MNKTIKVDVNWTDIRLGLRGDPWACAVTRAFGRCRPGASEIHTDGDGIEWDEGDQSFRTDLPEEVNRFIGDFDFDRNLVGPISFEAKPEVIVERVHGDDGGDDDDDL